MEFKIGDRVRYIGMIHDSFLKNKLGEVKEKNNDLYNLVRFYLGNDDTIDMYMADRDLELIEENKKITLEQLEKRIEKLEKEVFKPVEIHDRPKETKPSLLTEDEIVILRNLDKKWKWIARDENGCLCVYDKIPQKGKYELWLATNDYERMNVFKKGIFQFIKWTDSEPYNIEELLKGEMENEKGI